MQTLCARRVSQSCAVSLRSIGRQCFHCSRGSDGNSQQGSGAGRTLLLLQFPAQPCCSCLSAYPVCHDLCLQGCFALAVLSPFIPPHSLTAAEHMNGFGEGCSLLLRHWGAPSVLVLWQGGHTGNKLVKHSPSLPLGLPVLQQLSHSDWGSSGTGFCHR